jgi:hypothetical protein
MSHLFVLFELLFFCSLFGIYGAGFLFFGVFLYHAMDYFLFSKLHIRLRPSLFIFFLQPASFGSSAKKLGVYSFLGVVSLLFGLLTVLFLAFHPILERLNPGLIFFLACICGAISFLFKRESFPNPLYLAQQDLVFAIRGLFEQSDPVVRPVIPGESAQFLAQEYPLLRITNQFMGDALFTVRIKENEKPHVIFVVMESFRAKNTGCLGAKLALSPNFDALAQQGVLFSNFHSTGTLTSRAVIASLFGVPPAHKWWHLNRYAQIPLAGLPQALASEGYSNALIQGGAVSFDYGIEFFGAQNYQTILGNREIRQNEASGSTWGVFDEYLMPYAATWLEAQTAPTFLTLFTITNHHPWISPPTWTAPKETGAHPYLSTYAYSDAALGILIQELRERKLLEKCILFIFGDHGQQTPEGDPYSGFNDHLKQENVHVPLLIYAEGRIDNPQVIDTISSQVDLLPTVFDLLQIKQPHHSLGKSLVRPSTAPIFFSHPYDSDIQGCRKGDWKFLIDKRGESLYNLAEDKEENWNLLANHSSIAQELKQFTFNYTANINALYENRSLALDRKQQDGGLGPHVLQLDFAGNLRFDDDQLIKTAKACPNLAKLSLAHCCLITDVGLKALLLFCPRLEILNIEGLDEVTGEGFELSPKLTELHAVGCYRFTGWQWIRQLYSLRNLRLESEFITDEQIRMISENLHSLHILSLSGMRQMQDSGLKALFLASPYMEIVSIQNCPLITDDSLLTLHQGGFRYVEIIDCPQITVDTIKLLASGSNRVVRF